jgi:hypothetical protein
MVVRIVVGHSNLNRRSFEFLVVVWGMLVRTHTKRLSHSSF